MDSKLQYYNPKKVELIFSARDMKVEEKNKDIQLNHYAQNLFTSFSIYSPELKDKKGVFIFLVDGEVVYVGMTESSLYRVIAGTYGSIKPRNLHIDGQTTACRLNTFLNKNFDRNIELLFIENENKDEIRRIKKELIDFYNPKINIL